MEYGRLGKTEPAAAPAQNPDPPVRPGKPKFRLLLISTAALLVAVAVSAAIGAAVIRSRGGGGRRLRPSRAMSRACGRTRFPALCVDSLLHFPGAAAASEEELVHISVNMTLQKVGRALYSAAGINNLDMDPHARSAYNDCLELLDDSVDLLTRSLNSVSAGLTQDVLTWLSAALTNQDTCTEGLDEIQNGVVKDQMSDRLKDLSEIVSNSLSIYAAGDDFSGVPIQNRRLLSEERGRRDFPIWLSRQDRELLDSAPAAIGADIVVSKDGGNGTVKTISEAIKKAPEHSSRRFIIHVRAGMYEEKELKLGRKKTNIMLIGDGKGKTVIAGRKNVQEKMTTFHTASFGSSRASEFDLMQIFLNFTQAATGAGFMARDITFANYAGPTKHQAVALRVGADHAVIYRCSIIGYQDTLYTYLGRPWKMYSRTVYLQSYMGDHIHPSGWLEWNGNFALDTLYYGEYMNFGPGAALGQRVKWPGYRVIKSADEASRFTVEKFISGSEWLPSTGVAFVAGLSS
ncbi:plant invertase/pectin methylesterase inhibitor [Striga asiatica]|uniref:Plant invertase/pectin methylesterase inhibitor n=1 Tax=Striga asiatica TaxID=4170 RepID=A0A5A7NXI7_STRAF|nr:plant invertase/pectin methylesterase inhibitor [Striga asiatica]